jgi:hypothetical protein
MPWARIDDGFDDHPKVLTLLEEDQGIAAVGLWTLCLTWAHRNTRRKGKTPGLIPSGLPRRYLGPAGRDIVKLLVVTGLWDEVDGGWMIHDFGEYLPSEETKAARSEAGKKGAAKRWGAKKTEADDSAEAEAWQVDGKLPSSSHDDASNGLANDGSRAGAHRVPTPVPEPSDEPTVHHETSAAEPHDETEDEKEQVREDVERVCKHLADRLIENGCKQPAITKTWRDAARLLMDKDGRTEDQIRRAIDWCQNDSFWKSNVMSMPKLREKYDTLRLRAEEERNTRASPNGKKAPRPDIDKRDEWKFSR